MVDSNATLVGSSSVVPSAAGYSRTVVTVTGSAAAGCSVCSSPDSEIGFAGAPAPTIEHRLHHRSVIRFGRCYCHGIEDRLGCRMFFHRELFRISQGRPARLLLLDDKCDRPPRLKQIIFDDNLGMFGWRRDVLDGGWDSTCPCTSIPGGGIARVSSAEGGAKATSSDIGFSATLAAEETEDRVLVGGS